MNSLNTASLVNLLGFTLGIALYALLFAMVVRHRKTKNFLSADALLTATSLLGILWNVGELFTFIWLDFRQTQISPFLTAVSYSAIGFLPSVVVHSALKNSSNAKKNIPVFSAYGLSFLAAILHFETALFSNNAPSIRALQILTFGSLALLAALFFFNSRQTIERKAVWISALLIFTFSALHLSGETEEKSWLIELVAHQSSLPLALAILFQDYRFAFADLFLKRALSLILLTLTAFGLYIFIASPLLRYHETHDRNDAQAIALIITLWIATALIYPLLHRFAVWSVDKILRRADYKKLRFEIGKAIENLDSDETVLDKVAEKLKPALTAQTAKWKEVFESETNLPTVSFTPNLAEIFVPTAELPFYKITLADFAGGRFLLSDEIETLEEISLAAARRIDAVRVTHARYEQELREQKFSKLATEAQLSALRAQINPHFLFNALTTIGYLIQVTPEKAFETLLRLTQLLRGVLNSTKEFSTLGEELSLIESYLDIEKARFEEKLQIKIEIPNDLLNLRVPSLIFQPLVENAVKHGISKIKTGGEVCLSAKLETVEKDVFLRLTVTDTGKGVSTTEIEKGIGLANIEQRLRNYYGNRATLSVENENGTRATIFLPIEKSFLNEVAKAKF